MKYSFKDILIGIRNEYLEVRNQLNIIENSIKIIDQELSKCIVLLDNDTKSINCYFYSRKKEIIDAIINIQNHLNVPLYNLDNLVFNTNINSIYHFKNELKHYHIIIENLQEFNNNILNILNSNYIIKMNKIKIDTLYNNKIYNLNYDYNSLNQELNDNISNFSIINYYPNKDFIKLDYLGILSNDILKNNLNVLYDSNNFTDYQRDLIEKEHKDIVLFNDETKIREFKIEEEEKRLVLVKR